MNISKQSIPNTNYEVGRRGKTIIKIVVHWIVGTLSIADAQFKKINSTSAHYGVEDNGVYQWVEEKDTAYHAGNFGVNLESVGIEHSADSNRPASNATYQTSGELIAQICKRHNIPLDRQHIIKHSEVVSTQCPGTVDIDKLITIAKSYSTAPLPTDRRPYWFDLINSVTFKLPHEKVTDQMVNDLVRNYPGQLKRSGLWDKVVIAYLGQVDTNQITVDQVVKAVQSQNTSSLAEQLKKCQEEIKVLKQKLQDIRNLANL